mmetsp:Transcript_97946/g.154330  ORF Transcript_97946/g.154330 Transcript_97946/m.154330 type:complete len:398 (-) Transcript_97946:120-1313(-)
MCSSAGHTDCSGKCEADNAMIDDLLKCLEDDNLSVRRVSMEILGEVTEKGDERIVRSISDRLLDERDSVRMSAAQAFAQVVDKGDQHAAGLVFPHLEHDDEGVREVALVAMDNIVGKDDDTTLELIQKRLAELVLDERAITELRVVILVGRQLDLVELVEIEQDALVRFVKNAFDKNCSCPSDIIVVSERVEDPRVEKRLMALHGLRKVLNECPCNLRAADIAANGLRDDDPNVRTVALEALKDVPEKSRERIEAAVTMCLRGQDQALQTSILSDLVEAIDLADAQEEKKHAAIDAVGDDDAGSNLTAPVVQKETESHSEAVTIPAVKIEPKREGKEPLADDKEARRQSRLAAHKSAIAEVFDKRNEDYANKRRILQHAFDELSVSAKRRNSRCVIA